MVLVNWFFVLMVIFQLSGAFILIIGSLREKDVKQSISKQIATTDNIDSFAIQQNSIVSRSVYSNRSAGVLPLTSRYFNSRSNKMAYSCTL